MNINKTLFFVLSLTIITNSIAKDKEDQVVKTLKNVIYEESSKYKALKKTSNALAILTIAENFYSISKKGNPNPNSLSNEVINENQVAIKHIKEFIDSAIESKESIFLELVQKLQEIYKKYNPQAGINEQVSREAIAQITELILQRMSNYIISTNVKKRFYRRAIRTITTPAILSLSKGIKTKEEKIVETFIKNFINTLLMEIAGEFLVKQLESNKK